jgi:hypothetical protein
LAEEETELTEISFSIDITDIILTTENQERSKKNKKKKDSKLSITKF